MNIPKVSIIVPVYNAGERFVKCMDTLVNQTLRDIEIILVLDCPTDGTDLIAKEYASKDERITVLENSTNLHIGESRNRGIDIAKGEYIGFSDHDDYRELNMYEKLYSKAKENNSDVVLSWLENVEDIEMYLKTFGPNIYNKDFILRDLLGFGYGSLTGNLFVRAVNCIYRRKMIDSSGIKFVDTRSITPEDLIFQIESINHSSRIDVVGKQFYYHVHHTENEGNKNSYISYEKRGEGLNYIYSYLQKEGIFETYKSDFYTGVTKQFLMIISGTLYPHLRLKEFLRARKRLRFYPFCKEAFRHYAFPSEKNKFKNRFVRKVLILLMR